MAEIFISYERSDHPRARRVAEALEGHGWSVWWDRKLLAGDPFDRTVQHALDAASCVIVLWSDTSVRSDWVKDEASEGAKRGILVPLLIDDVEIPLGFRQLHTARLTDWETTAFPLEFPDVVDSVSRLVGRARPTEAVFVREPSAFNPGGERSATPIRSRPKRRSWGLPMPGYVAAIAATVVISGLIVAGYETGYFNVQGTTPPGTGDDTPRQGQEAAPRVSTEMAALGGAQPGGAVAPGSLEFTWPGDDCWDIYRGEELVTTHCGSGNQALQAGSYTVKPKYDPVFAPFEVSIEPGSATKVETGGVFEFTWPGDDCWDIYRGEELVTTHCGSGNQALQAGSYTIKPKYDPVFAPFGIQMKDGGVVKVP